MKRLARQLHRAAELIGDQDARRARRARVPLVLYRFFKRAQAAAPIQTVLDVGANRGDFSRYCLRCFPEATVHAFEPLPACQPLLKTLADREARLHIHPVALGQTAGEVEMYENQYNPSSSLLRMLDRHREIAPKTAKDWKIRVRIESLDGIAERVRFEPPLFLKLDVQGYEMSVLKGGSRVLESTAVILTEVLFEPLYEHQSEFAEIVSFLRARGFRFSEFVDERRFPPLGALAYADAAFVR